MKIALIGIDPSFGNAPGIFKALSIYADVIPVFRQKDPKGMWKHLPALYGYENIPKADLYFIISGECFADLQESHFYPARIILTDSYYLNNYKELNKTLKDYTVYCMPDLMKYYGKTHSFFHPFEYGRVKKSGVLTICHSPYSTAKRRTKGTEIISRIVMEMKRDIKLNYELIVRKSWIECLRIKSRSHLFIDQISQVDGYGGAVGKSGVEAMAMDCVVFTSGDLIETDIPLPPVIKITAETLKDKLMEFIENRDEQIEIQSEWVKKYCSYEFVGKHLLK